MDGYNEHLYQKMQYILITYMMHVLLNMHSSL